MSEIVTNLSAIAEDDGDRHPVHVKKIAEAAAGRIAELEDAIETACGIPAARERIAPAELSGDTGELIDRMAAAIREDGGHYDDAPWESLSDERKEGWRGDARRALAVVKEYLTARLPEPASRTVTEAMVEALKRIRDTAMEHTLAARIPECGVFGGIAQDADWLLSELTAAMETSEAGTKSIETPLPNSHGGER